ncbi:hypothetical protein BC936DRAFT_143529 [Jimgerdemannia flammicorona]|uniref:Uncharacterized protein n=1 Tax=Jimgerdemannia flammicorona TaxID=994334 RepID=A0A432ZYW7_9FUNG|nr:hypothetical protein BC936DRAFT_143529 [Jimgerdemannia flammicorona]
MNSTPAEPANTPLIPDLLVTTVIAWLGVAFCSLSCVVISYKAFQEYNRLRFGCVVLGALVLILCVVNTQRIWGNVTDDQYSIFRTINLILFIDLMVAITFDLGGRFYLPKDRVNVLYWSTIVATAIVNVMLIMAVVLQHMYTSAMGTTIDKVMRICWPVSVFLAYWYAFHPVIKIKKVGSTETHSSVVAVGICSANDDIRYLTGMGVLLLLHIIAVLIVIPYPPEYKELNIIESSFATALRSGLLGFYSFPPSATVILAVRRRFHRDSLNDKHLGPGIRLPDNDSNV